MTINGIKAIVSTQAPTQTGTVGEALKAALAKREAKS